MPSTSERPLGRRKPEDFQHVESYPFAAVAPATVVKVERTLRLPYWHWSHDQGSEGSCVGHGVVMERAIANAAQNKLLAIRPFNRRYNPLWTWDRAKERDEWPDTNPGDTHGTSVRAAYDVTRELGAQRVRSMKMSESTGTPVPVGARDPSPTEGVSENRWATNVDEIRTAISLGSPVVIGVDWYSGFDVGGIIQRGREWWLPKPSEPMGHIRGGHAVCLYGASDDRQAFKLKNSWGKDYPLVWVPYETLSLLLRDQGEAALVTDR